MSKPYPQIDTASIRELARIVCEADLSSIEIKHDGTRIRITRNTLAAPSPSAGEHVGPASLPSTPAPPAASPQEHDTAIPSPLVGTVYLAPEPGAAPFVQIGDRIEEGQTLLVIEAMKTMNHVPAPQSGTIREILVQDAQVVEYDQALFMIS